MSNKTEQGKNAKGDGAIGIAGENASRIEHCVLSTTGKEKTQFANSITTRHNEKFNHHPRIKYKKLQELFQTWLKPWTCCYLCEAATAGLLTTPSVPNYKSL